MDEREDLNPLDDDRTTPEFGSSPPPPPTPAATAAGDQEPAIIEEVKIEEVGIDGMCGVY